MRKYSILKNVLRPIIGPSSSHTYAPACLGYFVYRLLGRTEGLRAKILFFGPSARTCKMHGSYHAITAGLLGYSPYTDEIEVVSKVRFSNGNVFIDNELQDLKIEFFENRYTSADGLGIEVLAEKGDKEIKIRALSIGGGNLKILKSNVNAKLEDGSLNLPKVYKFENFKELLRIAEEEKLSISELAILRECEVLNISKSEALARMFDNLKIMEECVERGLKHDLKGVIYDSQFKSLSKHKDLYLRTASYSIAVMLCCVNMHRIVSAPTAGSCGILPACLLAFAEENDIDRREIVKSMFTAGVVGLGALNEASVSAARHGCQAEIGVASAMTAAALAELMNCNAKEILEAASLALSSSLGIVCDPVAGLVEVPCINRNATFSSVALTSAYLAANGTKNYISLDDVLKAMDEIGKSMSPRYKETSLGGLAGTRDAKKLACKVRACKRFCIPVKEY